MRRFLFAVPAVVLLLSGSGCIVTRSAYEVKSKETDSLRNALASLNREKAKLAEENSELSKRVAAGKEAEAALAGQVKERDESLKRLGENRVGRERLIDELLEGEKATGRKVQELTARAEGCDRELAEARRAGAEKEREIAELENRSAILSGRIERIREETRDPSLRMDEKLRRLSAGLAEVSPQIGVIPVGTSLRIVVPEKLLIGERGGKLTKTGTEIVSRISGAVAEMPATSLLVVTGGKDSAETVRAAASGGGIPRERLLSHVREKERAAEFLLFGH
ncbi:MAG: hypothetical protein AB1346_07455 [Thermodesulfobacteriota bacterium]